MLEVILFAMGLADIDENDETVTDCPAAPAMSVSAASVPRHEAEVAPAVMDVPTEDTAKDPVGGPTGAATAQGQLSAPSSPCVSRRAAPTADSRIPQPLPSPTPLRRSGSLRLRGEKPGFGHPRHPLGLARGSLGLGARASPGAAFPSITEASESWKRSLRGMGDGLPAHGPAPPPPASNLRHQRHHRSLQSLSSRPSSRDAYPHTPTPSPEEVDFFRPQNLNRFLLDHAKEFGGDHDDLDSLRSYGSNCSTQSACDHAQFARNGTTFSGKRMKYIVHCSSHPEPNEYLTPTQRANQQVRRLKALVEQARKDIEAKDENIFKLTKEVVELRLLRDEVDSPAKTTRSSEDSPPFRVTTQLENECGNSTSLSDSGHFDDVLSLISAQSAHSPGPRQVLSSPEAERLAEVYQHKIDDVTRKQGEKSLEDRKSLVKMYEKKMEDMSRKYSEKFQQEKNDLIEMYENKIGDIVRRHQEKSQEDKVTNEKRIDELSQLENQNSLQATHQSKVVQSLTEKLEETQQLLETAQKNATSLSQQLEDVNLRYNDLQHELFQSREKTVLLEDEIETLQKTIAMHEQQVSEKNVALVQSAQIESELSLLRQHVEEQKVTSELKSQLESELARVSEKLKEKELKCKLIEDEKTEAESLHHQRQEEDSKLISQLKDEISDMLHQLKAREEKCKEIEDKKTELQKNQEASSQLVSKLKNEISEVLMKLKAEEQKRLEAENKKTEAEIMYQEKQEEFLQLVSELRSQISNLLQKSKDDEQKHEKLKSQLQTELMQISVSLKEEKEKNIQLEKEKTKTMTVLEEEQKKIVQLQSDFENARCEMFSVKEEENRHTVEFAAALEKDLAALKIRLGEEEEKNKNLECWKQEAENMKEEITNHIQHEKQLTEQLVSLESEVDDLKTSLLEEKESRRNVSLSTIQNLEEKLDISQKEANKQSQEMNQLRDRLSNVESEAVTLSNLLSEERLINEELLHWKTKAENLQSEINSLKEDIVEKTQQLQYFASIESKVIEIQDCLSVEKEKVQDLMKWRIKANDLEEEIKSLKEEISSLSQNVQLSENNNTECLQNVPFEAQQKILSLEAEIVELRESLDQSYWMQSEKDTTQQQMEKTIFELTAKMKKMEEDSLILNEAVTCLKNENDELKARAQQNDIPELLSKDDLSTLLLSKSGLIETESNAAKVHLSNNYEDKRTMHLQHLSENGNIVDTESQLRAEIESLKKAIADQEERHTEMNLKMYLKGQEAAKFERKDQVLEMAAQAPEKVSVPELLSQLAETEKELDKVKDNQLENKPKSSLSLLSANEAVCLYLLGSFKAMYRQLAEGQASNSSSPEATLLFLKSAFYYFLTDEANCQGHLHAIQSILGFTESEKQSIDTLTYIRR
ncbi:calponin homology domain-containing protein DDB_G0272472 isoform X2 [Thrips palmi]|uniref:Calponin homology domain-containing protein DDB_G0272472 isoform X2 n=1 Tax=Thrips palmi TaxID=161013 RepID=A0A6P8YND8_THRPL|nr:calponin homology domain-containing protein DDB_G0272472 isoform X2 [Thrips palmi]